MRFENQFGDHVALRLIDVERPVDDLAFVQVALDARMQSEAWLAKDWALAVFEVRQLAGWLLDQAAGAAPTARIAFMEPGLGFAVLGRLEGKVWLSVALRAELAAPSSLKAGHSGTIPSPVKFLTDAEGLFEAAAGLEADLARLAAEKVDPDKLG